jgi:hypothetical protein
MAAQPASIAGTVTDHATSRPMAGVHVRLLSSDFSYRTAVTAYGAITDPAGRFSIGSIGSGIYTLAPEFPGFILRPADKSGDSIPLRAGQHLSDYHFEMTAMATITGKVVDEFGDPVQRISVELEAVSNDSLRDLPYGFVDNPSNDLGEFHLAAAPGRYYVRAQLPTPREQALPEIRSDGSFTAPFISTYFPSSNSKSAASVVELKSGADLGGVEIHLLRAGAGSGQSLSIGGVVTGAPDNKMSHVELGHGDSFDELEEMTSAAVQPDGSFFFRHLEPGPYRLFAHVDSSPPMRSQTVDFNLTNDSENNVRLALSVPQELTGVLEVSGDAEVAKRTVSLDPVEMLPTDNTPDPTPCAVGRDGSFRIGNVSPGRFRAIVDPMPENGYIDTIALDGTAAADGVVELIHGAGSSRLKITVKRDGAQISGRVLDKDGMPVMSPMVMIFLVTDPKELLRMNPDRIHKAVDAQYMVKTVRPGKYRLFAVDSAALGAASGDLDEAEIAKRVFSASEEIEIKPGDRIVKDLKAIERVPAKEPLP